MAILKEHAAATDSSGEMDRASDDKKHVGRAVVLLKTVRAIVVESIKSRGTHTVIDRSTGDVVEQRQDNPSSEHQSVKRI